jgi:lipid A 4'-phosphatase
VKKMRQNKNLERRSDSIGTEKARDGKARSRRWFRQEKGLSLQQNPRSTNPANRAATDRGDAVIIPERRRDRSSLAFVYLPIVLAAGIALALWPQIDIAVADFFYAQTHFIGDTAAARLAREFGRIFPFVLLAAMTLLWMTGKIGLGATIAPRGRTIAWLVLSMALGPGLLVDGLKNVSHRPRPVHVRQFGGAEEFKPFYRFDGACMRNCSFPSGEASAAFWTMVPASLAPSPLRLALFSGAALFGLATGSLRMTFGAHFLSDVFFAAILTLTVAWALRRIKPPSNIENRS